MKEVYFKDNFFSRGITEIFNENQDQIGYLDLKSAFTSSVAVCGLDHKTHIEGRFSGFFKGRWIITGQNKVELGRLQQSFSFTKRKFVYETADRGNYTIVSKVFSKEYQILNEKEEEVVCFERVSGFFESRAYKLVNRSELLSTEEWTAVVMGVNMFEKMSNDGGTAAMGGAVT
ncbi:hypothetical protein ACFQPF_18040 [Fictibacillus iocasae]|uniref:Uncharacterized protein n=1 Tax=Fictibacillus iocasae TaxID=2715437 RepID=A0ABW2NT58_9BACL